MVFLAIFAINCFYKEYRNRRNTENGNKGEIRKKYKQNRERRAASITG